MSREAIQLVWDLFPEGGGTMITALALANHGGPDGDHIFPSVARVARMTRQSERTVQRHIQAMIEAGWLVVDQPGGGPAGKTTIYSMPIADLRARLGVGVTKCHPSKSVDKLPTGVTNSTGRGDNLSRRGDIAVSPKEALSNKDTKPDFKGPKPRPRTTALGPGGRIECGKCHTRVFKYANYACQNCGDGLSMSAGADQ